MIKKVFVFGVVTILLAAISGTLGYAVAYANCSRHAYDMFVSTRCHVLMVESYHLALLSDERGIAGLIDAVELNCDSWASYIRENQLYCSAETKKQISKALEEWEKAKRKLEELRSLYLEEKQPDSG